MLGVRKLGGPRAGSLGVRVTALAGLHQPPARGDRSVNPARGGVCILRGEQSNRNTSSPQREGDIGGVGEIFWRKAGTTCPEQAGSCPCSPSAGRPWCCVLCSNRSRGSACLPTPEPGSRGPVSDQCYRTLLLLLSRCGRCLKRSSSLMLYEMHVFLEYFGQPARSRTALCEMPWPSREGRA